MSMFPLNINTAPSSTPPFSNVNLFGSTSGIQQTSNSGVTQLFGTMTSSSAPPFGAAGTFNFNAAKSATSGQTQNISPGLCTLPTFGKKYDVNSAPAFGVSSNSHFGTPRFDSYSFVQPAVFTSGSKGTESTTPSLKSTGFGNSAFGINQKGSRIATYIATPENDGPGGATIQSICGMQTYKDKSQEELRFEDYQLGDKGQKCGSSFGVSGSQGFGVINNTRPFISPVLNQSTVNQPFYSHFPSTFAVERPGVDFLSNENSTASTPFPKSQPSVSNIFPPKTSFLNTYGTGSRVESTASDVSFSPWTHSSQFAPLKPASSSSTTSTFSPLSPFAPLKPASSSSTTSTFSPLNPFAPLKPASSSSSTSTFSPLRNSWALPTPSPLSPTQSPLPPCSGSPSTYPLLAKPSDHNFDQKNSFSAAPVLTTGGTPQSTLCSNCLKLSQPTPPGLCNVSSTLPIGLENSRTSSQLSTGHPLAANLNTPLFFGPLQPEMTPSVGATLPTTNATHPSTGASCSEIGQGIGQPSINGQQSSFPRAVEVKPSPIMPTAETQTSVQISIEHHPSLATSIQYGISSLPVTNNPAPVRRKSSLIIRHSSLSQRRLQPQKYKPTSDKPKVSFFMDKENTAGVLRTEIIIPREDPRDWVRPTTKEFPLRADSCTSSLKHTSMHGMHDGDKVGDKPKYDPEEMPYDNNCGQLKPSFQVSLGSDDDKDVDDIMPKLQRADYYTIPPMKELILKEKEEAGFCSRVKDLVVGRHGYGSIKFLGETDIRKLDLDSAVHFNYREVIIYMDESKKPPVGQGLNKPAEITLLNVRCINKSTGKEYIEGPVVNKYRDMLIKKAVEQDAEFVSYDPLQGQWIFRVSHF